MSVVSAFLPLRRRPGFTPTGSPDLHRRRHRPIAFHCSGNQASFLNSQSLSRPLESRPLLLSPASSLPFSFYADDRRRGFTPTGSPDLHRRRHRPNAFKLSSASTLFVVSAFLPLRRRPTTGIYIDRKSGPPPPTPSAHRLPLFRKMATTQLDQIIINVEKTKGKACVVGGTGFVASLLVKLLLDKGYSVNTTVRDPDSEKKIVHLRGLQELGDLKIFKADLTDQGSFDPAVQGCDVVFLIATPVNFASQDPENDMIKPAIEGVTNVLQACAKAKSVKRVVMTSSAAALSINKLTTTGLVITEQDWSDVDFLYSEKPPTWGYPISKTLAEKTAWKFAKENNLDLITVIPTLMAGPSLTPNVPSSVCLATCLLTGNEFLMNGMKGMQMLSGSISITHVEDVCRAHVFLAENELVSGRYICCAVNTSVIELANFLSKRYPQFPVSTEFGDFPSKAKLVISSEKLVKEGFEFKYGIEEIYDQTVEYLKSKGLLKNN